MNEISESTLKLPALEKSRTPPIHTTPTDPEPEPKEKILDLVAGIHHYCAKTLGTIQCWGRSNIEEMKSVDIQTDPIGSIAIGNGFICGVREARIECHGKISGNILHQINELAQYEIDRLSIQNNAICFQKRGQAFAFCFVSVYNLSSAYVDDTTNFVPLPGTPKLREWNFICGERLWTDGTYVLECNKALAPLIVPEFILGPKPVQRLVSGYEHVCVLLENKVRCWRTVYLAGYSSDPQIRGLDLADIVAVDEKDVVTDIAAFGEHTCVIKNSSTISCFGGQLSQTSFSLNSANQIATGESSVCASNGHCIRCQGVEPPDELKCQ